MEPTPFVCLYRSYLQDFSCLSDSAKGKLITAMLIYNDTGQEPKLPRDARILWPMVRSQMDRDIQKYRDTCERNRIKGAKGGSAPRKAAASRCLAQEAKENENEKENEREKERERENENENEQLSSMEASPPSRAHFSPPDINQVMDYCREQGLNLDPHEFMDYYTSNGWKVGIHKMQDWQAAVRNWYRKEPIYGKTEMGKDESFYGVIL